MEESNKKELKPKNTYIERIPPLLRNKYMLTFLGFVLWLLFFDRHDILSQYKLRSELKKLEAEKAFYQSEIAKDSKNLNELLSNPKTLEKFAREKYLMKKDNEDIFVIVKE
jgi:cell division protein FtsB